MNPFCRSVMCANYSAPPTLGTLFLNGESGDDFHGSYGEFAHQPLRIISRENKNGCFGGNTVLGLSDDEQDASLSPDPGESQTGPEKISCRIHHIFALMGGVSDAVRARCGYWGCSVDPFSQFRGNCAQFGGPRHPQSACVPCFSFCNVFCHVPLFVGLLVSKFYCRILSLCLSRGVSLSWRHAGMSVLCALSILFACELAQGVLTR